MRKIIIILIIKLRGYAPFSLGEEIWNRLRNFKALKELVTFIGGYSELYKVAKNEKVCIP